MKYTIIQKYEDGHIGRVETSKGYVFVKDDTVSEIYSNLAELIKNHGKQSTEVQSNEAQEATDGHNGDDRESQVTEEELSEPGIDQSQEAPIKQRRKRRSKKS